jgi:alpha 1,3-mannosyltransferase
MRLLLLVRYCSIRRIVWVMLSAGPAALLVLLYISPSDSSWGRLLPLSSSTGSSTKPPACLSQVKNATHYWSSSPLPPAHKDNFGKLGQRARVFREWLECLETQPASFQRETQLEDMERGAAILFPFLKDAPNGLLNKNPFNNLRSTFAQKRGIVIPAGASTLRYAFHLIGALTEILKTRLPIQIVYAGDDDLPEPQRELLVSRFPDVGFLDITTVLNDNHLQLGKGGWAIKPFAALVAPFEKVILLDADSVFLQKPEVMFEENAYKNTGALLFHDRLLWQHAFQDRHDWFKSQIESPSATLNKSLVWTQDYAEEADSGAVVIDKSRLDVLVGLLHVCWQNTAAVREEVTYQLTYGDKESWWLGLELTGSGYAFEDHYGSMIGWPRDREGTQQRICSFVIGHLDQYGAPMWYNGGLLENKKVDPNKFRLPTHWMTDGRWEKGGNRKEMSCMVGEQGRELSVEERAVISASIEIAKHLDRELKLADS